MATISVKHYTNTMAGAPQLDNTWGELTGLLDAVLVNGFGFKTIDSITRSGSTATATVSTGHGYEIGQAVAIAGCNQAEYNGEFRVTAATGNTFNFEVAGAPASPATGTITAKVAPLNWEIAFSATSKRAYRSTHADSAKPLLVVHDGLKTPGYTTTWVKWANVGIAESMSDIDTITGAQAPYDPLSPAKNWGQVQAGQWGWFKWYWARAAAGYGYQDTIDAAGGAKSWVLVGDGRLFYLWINPYGAASQADFSARHPYVFGEPISFKAGDAYSCALVADDHVMSNYSYGVAGGNTACVDAGSGVGTSGNGYGHVLLKNYSGLAAAVGWSAWHIAGQSGYTNNMPVPNGPDYAVWMQPIYMREAGGHCRAQMPGVACLPQQQPLPDMGKVSNVQGQAGKTWLAVGQGVPSGGAGNYAGQVAVDITGPWR